jgi:hypothetical protein
MIRRLSLSYAICLLAVLPGDLFGQFKLTNPFAQPDPRVRRAQREQAVAAVGQGARDFVEMMGDDAVTALFACSKPVAVKLTEFHASGELGALPRPRDLLRAIAQPRHGDDVARWAMLHAPELADPDNFDAYVMSPLNYALGLKQIAVGAAEVRARRLHHAAISMPLPVDEKLVIAGGVGLFLIVVLLLRRRRQPRI